MRERSTRTSWRAMGSAVEAAVVGGRREDLELVRDVVARLEDRWSRFRPDSDVSRLNAAGGRPVTVDPMTVRLIEAMASGVAATGGSFDPTLLASLVAAGYAASWEDPSVVTSIAAGSALRGDVRHAAVDVEHAVVRLPPGTVIDAGGIGKGLAADLAVEAVRAAAPHAGVMVAIGGDVRVAGPPPLGGAWIIGVADDPGVPPTEHLSVLSAGVATSGTSHRAWRTPDGCPAHHLIDPRSGRPTVTGPRSVAVATVVAGTAAWAEVWTKALVVDGVSRTFDRLDDLRLPARVRLGDGTVLTNAAWSAVSVETMRSVP